MISLSTRQLNRALLARQFLIQRTQLPELDVLEHLIGLQSQAPNPAYISLWTRIEGFAHESLSTLLINRSAVRIALMRSTIFLVTSRDCLTLRPLLQSVLNNGLKGAYGRSLTDVDLTTLAAISRSLVEERPRTFNELGIILQESWPETDQHALSVAARTLVPLVQIPPRGIWGSSGQAIHTSAEHWLNRPLNTNFKLDDLILRYLKAVGPATISDMQAWSGLTRIREVTERLRHRLIIFLNAAGKELFDIPDAEIPEADTSVPVRYLGEFDIVLLSHKDRTRIMADEYRNRVFTVNGIIKATILIDGFVQGLWRIEKNKGTATLVVEPFIPLSHLDKESLTTEGIKLLAFVAPEFTVQEIQFINPA
ncbi:winged helix DNA-binding domain-containing protein [Paenibacillus psychroresistens]|uniref:Winged helix DNA-binding domain-containing protein n=1 Tax=Paenibacillus psychroresistens TaxID=1778678 RepID=A0A6B8RJE6_9BACL|nr:winged helix DNA-binding domain-containing protein [Paenibacillus psychroresistens]QGQ95516.1 winged helix DNA-binding domain-containing protein [Paenibacillus psychroresistens]